MVVVLPLTSLKTHDFKGLKNDSSDICLIEATVITGVEDVAGEECKEKLGANFYACRGRIFFDVNIVDIKKVLTLHSIEHVNIVIHVEPCFSFSDTREKCFEQFYRLAEAPLWHKGLHVWQEIFGPVDNPFLGEQSLTKGFCMPKPEIDLNLMKESSELVKTIPVSVLKAINLHDNKCTDCLQEVSENMKVLDEEYFLEQSFSAEKETQRMCGGPKYRVTCSRNGTIHKFGSSEAARQFGGGINEKFGWPVDLSSFDLEVILHIDNEFVYVALSLTREPLFKRNIIHFGPTNLRATTCYNLLRLADPKPGDVILDPMCGGATIPLEGSLSYHDAFHLGGDSHPIAVQRSRENLDHHVVERKASLSIDVAQWDVSCLPLRRGIVDVVVSDLPFGKRMGSKFDNRVLYFQMLKEMARVTKTDTGRAVLLTHDKNNMIKCLRELHLLWRNFSTRTINIGGLAAGIFLLKRTSILSDPNLKKKERKNRKQPMVEQDELC